MAAAHTIRSSGATAIPAAKTLSYHVRTVPIIRNMAVLCLLRQPPQPFSSNVQLYRKSLPTTGHPTPAAALCAARFAAARFRLSEEAPPYPTAPDGYHGKSTIEAGPLRLLQPPPPLQQQQSGYAPPSGVLPQQQAPNRSLESGTSSCAQLPRFLLADLCAPGTCNVAPPPLYAGL